jgi:spore germination cell wall hydrolase CwlJ-like protein
MDGSADRLLLPRVRDLNISELDRDAMIRTICGEADGEPEIGQRAVAHVILTRASTPSWWGQGVWGVCHAPAQFSCWNAGVPTLARIAALNPDTIDYRKISGVVDKALMLLIPDPTQGATHYKVSGTKASWDKATEGKTGIIIGKHVFFNLGPSA